MLVAPSKAALRAAYPDEAGELYRRYRDTVLVAYQHIFPPDRYPFPDQSVRKTWCDLVADHGRSHQLFVAEVDGAVVGAVAAKPGTIWHLFVVPTHWGTGVGDALLAAAVAVSRQAGASQCQLEVLEDNWRARRFYERHGWSRDHRRRAADSPPHPVVVGYTLAISSSS
jgi:ribosomal protein S18 acetylase RimI-like enzyme